MDNRRRDQRIGAALPDVLDMVTVVADGDASDSATIMQAVLGGLREFLGLEVAFIGEFIDGQRVFRYVDSAAESCPVEVGGGDPLEDSYCQRVVDGRLPQFITDAAQHPEAAALPVTFALPVGTHLSVPIEFSDGRVFGTFCAFSYQPNLDVRERDVATMRMLARLLGTYLERDSVLRTERRRAVDEITAVLESGAFAVVFQPIVHLETGTTIGYEALSRFAVGRPDEWFARAASVGLGETLELAAVSLAVRHLPEVTQEVYVAVNLSPATFCSEEFTREAAAWPLDRLVIELTEQTAVSSYDALRTRIRWLRTRGGRIAVDDAGSGYAGLQRILAIAPDIIKLDLELVRAIDVDPARQALATAMCWFADSTGASIVAEGIETTAELSALRALGVRHGQGYAIGRPGPLPANISVVYEVHAVAPTPT